MKLKEVVEPAEASTFVGWAIAIHSLIESEGVDANMLFQQAGLDVSLFSDSSTRYPLANMTKLWKLAVEATGNPALPLQLPSHLRPGSLHGLGFSIMMSRSVEDAINRTNRYSAVMSNAGTISGQVRGDRVELVISTFQEVSIEAEIAWTATLNEFVKALLESVGDTSQPTLHFDMPQPEDPQPYIDKYGENVEFGSHFFGISLKKAAYGKELPSSNPALAIANDAVVQEYIASFQDEALARIRQSIVEELSAGIPSLLDISNRLRMARNVLKRELKERGLRFTELREDVQCSLAKRLLAQPEITLLEITHRSGFTDQSNFTKAFRRWTGISPGKYRSAASAPSE